MNEDDKTKYKNSEKGKNGKTLKGCELWACRTQKRSHREKNFIKQDEIGMTTGRLDIVGNRKHRNEEN